METREKCEIARSALPSSACRNMTASGETYFTPGIAKPLVGDGEKRGSKLYNGEEEEQETGVTEGGVEG